MSEEINVLREDVRVTVSVAPEFPKERLLPLESSVLSKNISRQVKEERKYNEEKIKRDREGGGESSGIPCCKTLHVSIGYDGTNNNDRADGASLPPSRSNVAKLFHASVGEGSVQEGLGFFRYYCPGVGTVFPDIREYTPSSLGLIAAAGGENRVNWGITRLVDVLQGTLTPESPLLLDESQTMIKNMATNGIAKVLTGGLLENGEKNAELPWSQNSRNWRKSFASVRTQGRNRISWPCVCISMDSPVGRRRHEPSPTGCRS